MRARGSHGTASQATIVVGSRAVPAGRAQLRHKRPSDSGEELRPVREPTVADVFEQIVAREKRRGEGPLRNSRMWSSEVEEFRRMGMRGLLPPGRIMMEIVMMNTLAPNVKVSIRSYNKEAEWKDHFGVAV